MYLSLNQFCPFRGKEELDQGEDKKCLEGWGGGGVVIPIMACLGKLRPKGVPLFRLQIFERVAILLTEVY